VSQRLVGLESRLRLALRAVYPAPEESRERVRARLAATLASFDAVSQSDREDAPRTAAQAAPTVNEKLRLGAGSNVFPGARLAALALLGGLGGASLLAAVGGRKAVQVVYVDRPTVQAPVVAAPSAPAAPGRAPSEEPVAPSDAPPILPPTATPAPSSRRAHGERLSSTSTFSAERILLDEARGALVQGEPQRALVLLGRHRARFSSGLLSEERDAMRVEALVAASRYGEARAAARAFRTSNPRSLFLATVDSAVESIP
jgi:hypothetical protein